MTVPLVHLNYLLFFDWVWHTSLRVSVLIILLLLVKFVLRNKINVHLQYLLWSFVIVSLLLPWAPQTSFSLYNLTNFDWQTMPSINSSVNIPIPSIAVGTGTGVSGEQADVRTSQIAVTQNAPILHSSEESLKSIDDTSSFTHRLFFVIWLMGSGAFCVATILVNRRFVQEINGQSVLDAKLLAAFEEAKNKLNIKKAVPLIQTMAVTSPSLHGLFHPKLLIPVGILEEFSPDQLNHVFIHELGHYKRKDIPVNWLTQGLLILHWFNPIIWYAFYKLREDQEIACDAITLSHLEKPNSREYAFTLIKLLESYSKTPRTADVVNLLESKSQIKRRINRISVSQNSSLRWSVLCLAVVVALSFVTLTNANKATSSGIQDMPLIYRPVISVNSLETVKLNQDLVEYARNNYQGGYNYSSENDIVSSTYGWMLGGLDRATDMDGLAEMKKQAEECLPTNPIYVKSYDQTFLNDYYIVPYIQGQKFVGESVVSPEVNGYVRMDDGVTFSPREKLLNIDASDAVNILKTEKRINKPPIPSLIFHSALNQSSQLPQNFSLLPSYNESNDLTAHSILQPSWEFVLSDNTRFYVNQTGQVFNDLNIVPWYETYIAPIYNSQAVQVEPNILIRDDGWTLTVNKVSPLSFSQGGWGYISYDKSRTNYHGKGYEVFFTLENVNGKDKVFIPKGKVLGIVGGSGKRYNSKLTFPLDEWYIKNLQAIQFRTPKDGKTIEPGIFEAGMYPIEVDPSEQKLTQLIYQDEYGNEFGIPIQVPESKLEE